MSPPRVTLAGVPLWGLDQDGVEWVVTKVTGWDGADVRLDLEELSDGDGAYDPSPLYGARQITVEGRFAAVDGDADRRVRAETRLNALTSALKPVEFRVDDGQLSRQARVWRSGKPEMVLLNEGAVEFSLPLTAPDPYRYDVTEQVAPLALPSSTAGGVPFPLAFPLGFGGGGSSDAVVSNDGDATVWPRIYIPGPVVDPAVRNNTTGDELSFSLTLVAGDWLDITTDPRERTVRLNGTASRRGYVTAGSRWPSLPPGVSAFQYSAAASTSSTAVLRYRSGWS